jgi:hypothetical protein
MLIVACVEWGNYLGRGAEYVAKLRAGVARHLKQPFHFLCLTDDPRRHPTLTYDDYHDLPTLNTRGLVGWWSKLYLFSPFRFPAGSRVLYIDLDSVIVGNLDELAAHKGIIHLRDWGWSRNVYGSGIMSWDAGEHEEIWTRWDPAVAQRLEGDQDWLTELGGWPALPPAMLHSYRYHAKAGIPAGSRIVSFHGRPKPHEAGGWVPEAWR